MSFESAFQDVIEKLVKANTPVFITEGTVTKVNADSVDVERDELPELFKVRLQAVLNPGENGILVKPKVGSKVLCAMIENNPTDAFVLSATEVDTITIQGGTNGGLTITPELVKQLGYMKTRIDTIINAITNGVPVAQDGGVVYQQTMVAILEGITNTEDFSKIENDKITH